MRHLILPTYVVEIARSGSIRKAAEKLNITASALNRRLQDLEHEIGAPLFERKARGVRLTAAGEMFMRYARNQIAEAEQFASQVEELKGLRRGPVRIACSQALATNYLPTQIAKFRQDRPGITFDLQVMDHDQALAALTAYDVDLALVFRPEIWPQIRILATLPQRIVVIMRKDHPLAGTGQLRLSECLEFPLALPDRSLSGRQILDSVAARRDLVLEPQAESNSFEMLRGLVLHGNFISIQIEIGAPSSDVIPDLLCRSLDDRDIQRSDLALCQLRGRSLSVAAASFAETIEKSLAELTMD